MVRENQEKKYDAEMTEGFTVQYRTVQHSTAKYSTVRQSSE